MMANSASQENSVAVTYPVRFWVRMLPAIWVMLALSRILPWNWQQLRLIFSLDSKPALVASLTLGLGNLIAFFFVFTGWFFLRRNTDKVLTLDRHSLSYGRNGLETAYALTSLAGLRFRNGRFKRWFLILEFNQGKVKVAPEYENSSSLLQTLFNHLGEPLFNQDPRRLNFLWRVLRTEISWEMFRKNWWKTALVSSLATGSGKLLADASPATDIRIDLWLAFNFLLPILGEVLIHALLMRKWEKCFKESPSFTIALPKGYSAAVHRKVLLLGLLVYLVVYFLNLSDLMLNS